MLTYEQILSSHMIFSSLKKQNRLETDESDDKVSMNIPLRVHLRQELSVRK